MPPVIAAIAPYIAGAVTAIGGTTFAAAAVGAAVASAFTAIGTALFYSSVLKALAPKKPKGAGRGLDQQGSDATMPGRLLFGKVRVGGAWIIPPIVTDSGAKTHRVYALAIHEVDSFESVWADQTEITGAQIAAVTGTANDGQVTGGKYAGGANPPYVWIRRYSGSSTQTVDYILNAASSTAFPSTFRGRGIAYAAVTYKWSGSGSGYYWQTGIPELTFVVNGMKCYDPRLDSTNGGSGSHRYATPSTWEFTTNPALCASTFLMLETLRGGGGYDAATEIDWSLVAAAANICDASVSIPSGSQSRYTCNLVLDATALFEDNLADIIDCMLGRCVWRDGKWRLYAGAWDTATFTINEEDWVSPLVIQTVAPRREGRWNGVKCFYVDPDRNYQRVEAYPRTNATYMDDDAGERIWLEIERAGCNTEYEAQRHAEMILRQSRNQIKVTGRLGPKFQYLALWETGVINFASLGWSSKTFRLITYKLNPDGSVDVGFSEEQSTDWSDMASGDYSAPSTIALPDSNVQQPDTPTAMSLAETVNGTLLISLTPGEVKPLGTTFQLYASPASLWNANSAQLVWEGDANNAFAPYTYARPTWWHVRAHHGSYYSGFYPNTFGTFYMLTPRADNTNNNRIVPDGDMAVGTPAYWTLTGSSAIGNVVYVASAANASAGVLRFTKTDSRDWTSSGGAAARGAPHPNAVNTIGYPNPGAHVYWSYVKFRVNSYVAIGSYGGGNATSGGYLYLMVTRATSGDYANVQVYPPRFADLLVTTLPTLYLPNLTLGQWYELEDALYAPPGAPSAKWPVFDRAIVVFNDSMNNSGTQIDIDRVSVTDLGPVNAPITIGMQCSTYVSMNLSQNEMISEVTFLTGSSNAQIPTQSARDYWWEIGRKCFVSKPNSTQGPCHIRTFQTSDWLTLAGTHTLVHTVTLAGNGTSRASVTRVGSYNYIVEGYGLS